MIEVINRPETTTIIRYEGEINAELSRGLTLAVHNQLTNLENDLLIRKRVTHLITECLLNLTHHAEGAPDVGQPGKYVSLVIEHNNDHYSIHTTNTVSTKKVKFLTGLLDKVNSMSSSELYEHYMNQLQSGQYTNKGTAGLGFIDMARKSGHALTYEFSSLNVNYSRFSFQLIIDKVKK